LRDYENYNPITDLAHVGVVATQSLGVLAHPSLNVDTMEEFIEYARSNPGAINFASSGNASLQHIAGEMLKKAADIDILHIPYSGAGPAMTDLVAGRADIMITSLLGAGDYLESGRLKLLATTGPERTQAFPEVPTVAEAGYPDYAAVSYQAVYAPKGTPEAIINQLNTALREAANEDLVAQALERGLELSITTPEEMTEFLRNEAEKYETIIKEVGISL
jgi:tripartite-type tricarboxylate transporter receptor subunit TctC